MKDNNVMGTHSDECWRWHHECAVTKIERLMAQDIKQRKMLEDLLTTDGNDKWTAQGPAWAHLRGQA